MWTSLNSDLSYVKKKVSSGDILKSETQKERERTAAENTKIHSHFLVILSPRTNLAARHWQRVTWKILDSVSKRSEN